MTSMQFPGSYILFASSGLGRCSLAGGFGWDTVWWEKNVAGFFAQRGVTGRLQSRLQALADIPGEGGHFAVLGFPLDDDLPMNSRLPCCFLSVQQRTAYFPF